MKEIKLNEQQLDLLVKASARITRLGQRLNEARRYQRDLLVMAGTVPENVVALKDGNLIVREPEVDNPEETS